MQPLPEIVIDLRRLELLACDQLEAERRAFKGAVEPKSWSYRQRLVCLGTAVKDLLEAVNSGCLSVPGSPTELDAFARYDYASTLYLETGNEFKCLTHIQRIRLYGLYGRRDGSMLEGWLVFPKSISF